MTTTTETIGHAEFLALAYDLMEQHLDPSWRFRWDYAKVRLGLTQFRSRHLSFSRPLTESIRYDTARDTILHEIAHALAGPGHHHDQVWRDIHLSIGGNGRRGYDTRTDGVAKVEGAFEVSCPNGCFTPQRRHRTNRRLICKRCRGSLAWKRVA